MTQPWVLFFQNLAQRVGGAYSDSLSTVTSNVSTLQARVAALQGAAATLQAAIAALQAGNAGVVAQVAQLEAELPVDGGTWTPTFLGATVTGAVAYMGSWKSIGGELFWQVLVDATGGSVEFAAATMDVPVPAAIPGVFSAVNTTAYADYGGGLVLGSMASLPNFTLTAQAGLLAGRYQR